MLQCPICSFQVANQRGLAAHFRHQASTHPPYNQWLEDQRWEGKTENLDYVRCLECGGKAATLARHIKAAHKITAEEYRAKHGPEALIRATSLTEKRSEASKNRQGGFGKGETKIISCSVCGKPLTVSKFLVPGTHEDRCRSCQVMGGEAFWASKTEPEEYVTCRACGYRAENLCSHLQSAHPELVGKYGKTYPGAFIVALGSSIRDKVALRGLVRPPEFGQKIAATKRIDLTPEDFEPFLDDKGKVDHRAMCEALGI